MATSDYFRVEQSDDVTLIRFGDTSRFETADYGQLQRDLVAFVEQEQPRKLLVDLAQVAYCSTALINSLLMAERRIRGAAGVMRLFGLNNYMLETLERLKLVGSIFSVYPDEAAAKSA
jgi:anti-anti-sigma regulatory factor